jgi:hypothetical protein
VVVFEPASIRAPSCSKCKIRALSVKYPLSYKFLLRKHLFPKYVPRNEVVVCIGKCFDRRILSVRLRNKSSGVFIVHIDLLNVHRSSGCYVLHILWNWFYIIPYTRCAEDSVGFISKSTYMHMYIKSVLNELNLLGIYNRDLFCLRL